MSKRRIIECARCRGTGEVEDIEFTDLERLTMAIDEATVKGHQSFLMDVALARRLLVKLYDKESSRAHP